MIHTAALPVGTLLGMSSPSMTMGASPRLALYTIQLRKPIRPMASIAPSR